MPHDVPEPKPPPQVEREIQEVTPAIQARRRGDCQRHQIALISQEVALEVLRPEQAKQVIALQSDISRAQGAQDPDALALAQRTLALFMEVGT